MKSKSHQDKVTEARNPNSTNLNDKTTLELVELINREDKKVAEAVSEITADISHLVEAILPRFKQGGRLIYVGAGTSGRIGIIDAVECVPTFSLAPGRVLGILAGGKEAMFTAVEGLEDEAEAGRERMRAEDISGLDAVIGVAASGDTPFVVGALQEARRENAVTAALVCNPDTRLEEVADHLLKVIVGPEVLTGSTRMKAGTAQKMVLNIISTTLMIKLGKVYSNLMVDLNVSNEKLTARAINIFQEISNLAEEKAHEYLQRADKDLKTAIVMYEKNCDKDQAETLLKKYEGNLAKIIDNTA